jgi:LacI family transcriptional regulator
MARKTIADVARVAGVSKTTVSRVLAGQVKHVRTTTRERVLEAIDQLGYHPSNAARSLKSKSSCTLGAVGYGLEYFGPSCTLSGIEQEAGTLGYTILLHLIRELETNEVEGLLEEMRSRYVDGVIWAVPQIGDNHAWLDNGMGSLGLPIVFLSMEPRPDQHVVAVENQSGGMMATGHLVEQGCKHIGIVTGPLDWWEARERLTAWRKTLEAAGLPNDESYVAEGDWMPNSGERALKELLERHPEIDGVFASNDRMALGALRAARELGRDVPADMAVIGFDDISDAAFFQPPLSTIHQDMVEVGRRAVRKLREVIEAKRGETEIQPDTTWLRPEIVIRRSSLLGVDS